MTTAWPTQWTPDMMAGDLWAATTATIHTWKPYWQDLPPTDTWADEVGAWEDDLWDKTPAPIQVTDGSVTRDAVGYAHRTTATLTASLADPNHMQAAVGRWLTIAAHVCPLADAPPDGDPATVSPVTLATLWITSREVDPAAGEVTIQAEDLVTLLGSRMLTGGGRAGYLPAARTTTAVISEVVAAFAPKFATTVPGTAPDKSWKPLKDRTDGTTLLPLAGSAWDAVEAMCDLAGVTVAADGTRLLLSAEHVQPEHSGISITLTPNVAGVQGLPGSRRTTAAAVTRIIATGQDEGDNRTVIGVAQDDPAAAAQGFHVDEQLQVPTQATAAELQAAALIRLAVVRAASEAGQVVTPWLPVWRPGDLLTVAWAPADVRSYYVQSVRIPVHPADGITLVLRGPALARWQDEPDSEPWTALPPGKTWKQDL